MPLRHIFITGQPGVGKSTLIQKVLHQLQSGSEEARVGVQGFYTEEVRAGSERTGFDVVTLDGRRGPLARTGASIPRGAPAVGKYAVDVASFERLALPELRPTPGVRLYVIDEVGKMELFSAAFYPAVAALLDLPGDAVVLGTLPVPRYGRTIPQVEAVRQRRDVEVITITKESRDREALRVLRTLRQRLATGSGSDRSRGISGGGENGS